MNLFILAGIGILVAWIYIAFLREWLVARWPATFSEWHALEDTLWASSRTILVARGYWLLGIILGLHDLLANEGFDWTPMLNQLGELIPPGYRAPALSLFLILTGAAFEWLRRTTAAPGSMSAPGKAS
jgi:hypothetical protein